MSFNDESRKDGPVLVAVPCFSGAAWDGEALAGLEGRRWRSSRLAEGVESVEIYANHLQAQVAGLDDFVLAGDSYGAVISLVLACRRPTGLRGLVLSGGFAADPLPWWKAAAARMSRHVPDPVYRQVTLRIHAWQLSSPLDAHAEIPLNRSDYRKLFLTNTPAESYAARVTSVLGFDIRDQLRQVEVPTLVITPEHDSLVGEAATRDLVQGLPNAREIVLSGTGHMFRFTHPTLYADTITQFLDSDVLGR